MSIQVECGHCRASYKVKDEFAGRRAKCPKCKQIVKVPALEAPVAEKPVVETPVAKAPVAKMPRVVATAPEPAAPETPTTKTTAETDDVVLHADRVAEISEVEIVSALSGHLPEITLPLGYRLATVVVSVVMILLPLIYVGLIALVCYATYYHAVNHLGVFSISQGSRGRGGIIALVMYLGPLVMGGIMILFMIKPLFARSADESRQRSITPKSDPKLFSFVARLCETVGAPMPKRIDVDCDINASASFRRGMLSMFSGRDLILTVGLPLVVGLDLRQFAGVLAHEFGHFSQGTGMRLTYFIRVISFWFVRVVYERDEWDQRLEAWAAESHFWISIVLQAARLCVWLSRRILWVLMLIGHAVSGLLLRQMEFDADRQSARLVGSDDFETTSRRLAVLGAAMQGAQADLSFFYQEGRLADNMPRLIMINVGEMPEEVVEKVYEQLDEGTTGIFDTHPCHKDRMENVLRENAAGIFHLQHPATVLFSDFDGLSRAVTWDFYRSIFGSNFQPSKMHSLDDLLERQEREKKAAEAYERFFMGPYPIIRPLELPAIILSEPDDPKRVAARLREARNEMKTGRKAYDEVLNEYDKADDNITETAMSSALLQAKLPVPEEITKMRFSNVAEANDFNHKTMAWMNQADSQLAPFERASGRRLIDSLLLLQVPRVADKLEDGKQCQQDCDKLLPILREIEQQRPKLMQLRTKCAALSGLASQIEGNNDNERLIDTIIKHMRATYQAMIEIRKSLGGVRYPFDHADKNMTIGKCAVEEIPHEQDLGGILEASSAILNIAAQLRHRIFARLSTIAEQVETALGMEPLPMPPKKKETNDENA